MTTDQLGGTTYTYPTSRRSWPTSRRRIQYAGDISAPSVFNNGATGMRAHRRRSTTSAFAQDEWQLSPQPDAELRPALRLLHAAEGAGRPVRQVQPRHRHASTRTRRRCTARRRTTSSRGVAATYNAGKTVLRGGFGIFVGPGQGEDLIQPIESDRVNTTLSTGPLLAFPINTGRAGRQLHQQPEQPQLPAARLRRRNTTIPERVYQYTASVQRELGGEHGRDRGLRRQPGPQPVPAQRRQPDRRGA